MCRAMVGVSRHPLLPALPTCSHPCSHQPSERDQVAFCQTLDWHWRWPVQIKDGPASGENRSHQCRLGINDFCSRPSVFRRVSRPYLQSPGRVSLQAVASRKTVFELPNNQRQHRTLHIQKDVLPCALCCGEQVLLDPQQVAGL